MYLASVRCIRCAFFALACWLCLLLFPCTFFSVACSCIPLRSSSHLLRTTTSCAITVRALAPFRASCAWASAPSQRPSHLFHSRQPPPLHPPPPLLFPLPDPFSTPFPPLPRRLQDRPLGSAPCAAAHGARRANPVPVRASRGTRRGTVLSRTATRSWIVWRRRGGLRRPWQAAAQRSSVTGATRDAAAVVTSGGCCAWRTLTALLQQLHRELGLSACGRRLPAGGSRERQLRGRVRRLLCWDQLCATSRRGRVKSFSLSSLFGCASSLVGSACICVSFSPLVRTGCCWDLLEKVAGGGFFIPCPGLLFHLWSCCRSVCFVPVHTCITYGDTEMGAPHGC